MSYSWFIIIISYRYQRWFSGEFWRLYSISYLF